MKKPNYKKKKESNNRESITNSNDILNPQKSLKTVTTVQTERTEIQDLKIDLKTQIINEINSIRTNPEKYIEILEKDKEYFRENVLYRPNESPLRTQEGETAHQEAIKFLQEMQLVNRMDESSKKSPLEHSNILSKAANDHVVDIGKSGAITHEGSNKETISDRVEVYGEWDYVLCQNIDFGGKNVNEIIISFITGDGDVNRSHRRNMFRDDIHFVGGASGSHKDTEVISVICFAGNVRELNTVAPEIINFIPNHIKKINEEKQNPSKKIKTKFQIDDPDAPDSAVNYTTFKKMKLVEDRAKHCTQRIYTLEDGTQHIVEVFDDLKIRADTSIDNSKKQKNQ